MAYADFSLESLRSSFGIGIEQAPLFPEARPIAVPAWLRETLDKGATIALGSEKARSEFIIAPILLALRDLAEGHISIYSGQRLDGDANVGLSGECDFIIAATPPLPILQAPLLSVVEAKKNDIESGLGQCAAQMLGAQRFNKRDNANIEILYGCVTTGEAWQFLKFHGTQLTIDSERYYINELPSVLGVLHAMVAPVSSAS